MGLFIWDAQPSKIFVWDTSISKVFLWDTQVRPTWWQPWANTLLYLPLEQDVSDYSLNHYATTSSWVTYTTVWWVQSVHINSTGWISLTWTAPDASVTEQTCSIWYYVTSQTSSSRRCLWEIAKQNVCYTWCVLKENSTNIQYTDENGWVWSWTTITANQWNNVIITCDASARKIYINWTLAWSWTWRNRPRGNYPYSYEQSNTIFNSRDGLSASNWLRWNARELIFEDVVWDAQKVLVYYNATKNNYPVTLNSLQNINLTPTNEINITPNNNGSGNVQSI